ncbi:ATP-binding protein [Streptomyces sp. I05A-00742]|uniref:ATP-binding protein n=1 Tax=Streptomyces sp. I05A-00742 TaxID=2732853 RepID=UPI001488D337|nr:ATP-binding protein [Streptomyces sp. I05A-00742]
MEIVGSVPPEPGQAPPREPAGSAARRGSWRFTAPALPTSVPRARHGVRDLMRRQKVPLAGDRLDGLLLIVSELVTNAVQHAALLSPELTVEVSVGPAGVRVAVEDGHPYRPRPLVPDEERIGGRGLLLVQAVVDEAGGSYDVEHTPGGGKVVWASLPFAEEPAPTSPPRSR